MLWFSKLALLYGGKSVKLGILKDVSLRLNMISKCYFYLCLLLVWPDIELVFGCCFFVVPDIFRKIKINLFHTKKDTHHKVRTHNPETRRFSALPTRLLRKCEKEAAAKFQNLTG